MIARSPGRAATIEEERDHRMLIEHLGQSPKVHKESWVAPDATVCGDVRIGAGVRIMHGARLIAENGTIALGRCCIVMENAVVRATGAHDCSIGNHVLIGPNAHVVGARIKDEVFLASGTTILHGSQVGHNTVIQINAVVQVNSVLPPGTTLPVAWIASGDPARLFSPDQHDQLWTVQQPLDFPLTAYGIDRPLIGCIKEITESVSKRLAAHRDDKLIP
jgi:carbonic anhydrase/acetyltransferase-like protein (isoleucine patch superfamily)